MLFERKDIKKIIEISERIADGNKSLSAQDVIAFDTFYRFAMLVEHYILR